MAVRWQVKFRSLRAEELYTVNIYDSSYSGDPLLLTGAESPFYTQEDNSNDVFQPIRTQSGYLRIVDDGTANWRDLIPTTDIDRPVTLTDSLGNVRWQGFMQAQNFGFPLYEMPVEREFPIQCPLSVASRFDINTLDKEVCNFAGLLREILDAIPEICRPKTVVVQGGADAREWLLKRIDRYNLMEEDSDFDLQGKYDLQNLLQQMCNYWGWCARVYGESLYLTCADDSGEANALILRHDNQQDDLATLESGNDAGTVETMFSTTSIGNAFASTENKDSQLRGPSVVTLTADANETEGNIIDPMDSRLRKEMLESAWADGYRAGNVHYSEDVLSFSRNDFTANAFQMYGSFNVANRLVNPSDPQTSYWVEVGDVMHFKRTSDRTYPAIMITSRFEHVFDEGFFRLWGTAYCNGEKLDTTDGRWYAGNADMWMRLGIGKTKQTAQWWNGKEWVASDSVFRATIGNRDDNIFTRWWTGNISDTAIESNIINVSKMSGFIFLEFLGTDSSGVEQIDGQRVFDLEGFRLQFTKNNAVSKDGPYPNSGWYNIKAVETKEYHIYKSSNGNQNVREELSIDSIWGSENNMRFGYGVIANPDDGYMEDAPYNGSTERPEQHLVDRIGNYWATSKRMIECDLLTYSVNSVAPGGIISPRHKATIDGTTMYPIAIERDWAEDVVRLTLMEVNP